jgi:alpha-mannosidase
MTAEFVDVAQSMSTPSRKVIVSNEEDFFRDFEAAYGANLRQPDKLRQRVGLYLHRSPVSARVRRAVEKLRTAEASPRWSASRPEFLAGGNRTETGLDESRLYWEHN